jgi:hypothetical protein
VSPARRLALFLLVPLVAVIVLQLVPYGRDHRNPPDGVVAALDAPETEALAARACFDCHSNRTKWPWYASVAPLSWRIQSHVAEGREALNFTAFQSGSEEMTEAAGEAGETVTEGEMPPRDYLLMHPEARLSAAEKATLVRGLNATFVAYAEGGERGEGGHASAVGREASARGSDEEREGHDSHDDDDDDRD